MRHKADVYGGYYMHKHFGVVFVSCLPLVSRNVMAVHARGHGVRSGGDHRRVWSYSAEGVLG